MSLNWEGIARSSVHPTQVMILEVMSKEGEDLSPVEIARAKKQGVGHVGYHMRALGKSGFVSMTRTRQVRGAEEHFYKLARKATKAGRSA